jgi:hypothetical protein
MKFQSLVEPMDIRPYRGGWLINNVHHLQEEITDEDVEKMEQAMDGEIEEITNDEGNVDIREILLGRTMRFHYVQKAIRHETSGDIHYFECDCREYYFNRWCFASAYMQHKEELRLLGQNIVANTNNTTKYGKSLAMTKALQEASVKIRRKRLDGKLRSKSHKTFVA